MNKTVELDPVYVMLRRSKLERRQVKRWLLAYWFYYHAGLASKLSEYKGHEFFLEALWRSKAGNSTPRGIERDNFRGDKSYRAIVKFHTRYNHPEKAVNDLIHNASSVDEGLHFLTFWPMFDLWASCKALDSLHGVLGVPVRGVLDIRQVFVNVNGNGTFKLSGKTVGDVRKELKGWGVVANQLARLLPKEKK